MQPLNSKASIIIHSYETIFMKKDTLDGNVVLSDARYFSKIKMIDIGIVTLQLKEWILGNQYHFYILMTLYIKYDCLAKTKIRIWKRYA